MPVACFKMLKGLAADRRKPGLPRWPSCKVTHCKFVALLRSANVTSFGLQLVPLRRNPPAKSREYYRSVTPFEHGTRFEQLVQAASTCKPFAALLAVNCSGAAAMWGRAARLAAAFRASNGRAVLGGGLLSAGRPAPSDPVLTERASPALPIAWRGNHW